MEMLVERLIQFGYFAGQTVIIVIALLILISFLFSLAQKNKNKSELQVEDLNQKYDDLKRAIQSASLPKKQLKAEMKQAKKAKKKEKQEGEDKPTLFVLNFEGDIKAHAVENLSKEISAILTVSREGDEVVVCVESPGGVVHGYGLAAAQLLRIKNKGLKLTICVDKVAASGGYMMACVADRIIAAPFAIVGSVGVLAQVPNFNKLLKKNDIDYREITAGDYKRTISMLGEITEKGEKKFTEQIIETHELFKNFVSENRTQVEISKVGTGEYWFAKQALDLKLVDELMTSDEFLHSKFDSHKLRKVSFEKKKKFSEKLGLAASQALFDSIKKLWFSAQSQRWL